MNSKNAENSIAIINTVESNLPPLPDLVVSGLLAPEVVISGAYIKIVLTLANQGDGPAWGSYTQVYLSEDNQVGADTYLGGFYSNDTIWAGQEVTQRESMRLPIDWEGEGYVIVTTDGYNSLFEHENEDNNTTVDDQLITVSIPPLPDLVVSNISTPVEAFSGSEIEVVWTITNQGEVETTGGWDDRVYLSDDNQVGADTYLGNFRFYGTIAAGEEVTRRESIRLPIGW